jgi:hypothetical protein
MATARAAKSRWATTALLTMRFATALTSTVMTMTTEGVSTKIATPSDNRSMAMVASTTIT